MRTAPIGIFDSGLGGLTVRRELFELLPREDTIYLADSANAPYGEKSPGEILHLSRRNTEWLLSRGCKLIVVACNTATTNAIESLRREFGVPFIGIEPAIKPAALESRSKKIGVLATRGTLTSSLFANTSRLYASGIQVLEKEGKGLVRIIESGKWREDATKELLKSLLEPMLSEGIDHLVLGCTHYPLLIPQLREFLPDSVKILDPGPAVARQTLAVLNSKNLAQTGKRSAVHKVFTTGDTELANQMLRWLGYSQQAQPLSF
ncbi:MAG: glutamate racemase [Robiginitalea sp.]|jgi:glutamate racemase